MCPITPNSDDSILSNLTEAQRRAVCHIDGPQLILAGPGSGKTRVVSHRIAHLLRSGVSAHQIVGLTFTNKAAEEMKNRVEQLAPGERVWLSTYHRFCSYLLRQHGHLVGLSENFTIYDTGDSKRLLRGLLKELNIGKSLFRPERIAAEISHAKNQLIGPQQYQKRSGSPLGAVVTEVYPEYQSRLLSCNAVDFDDMLFHVAVMLRENEELRETLDERYRYILVDEYQDTNLAQYLIVRALSNNYPNLSVTGDPDQSIYAWRGANVKNILSFEKDFPEVQVVRLEKNYRSTKNILRVAATLIANNTHRKKKDLFTDNDPGQPVRSVRYQHQSSEAEDIARQIAGAIHNQGRRPKDFAIFYRINALSREFEHTLADLNIPYQLVKGVEFYQRREIKDIIGYLQLMNNPRDNVALGRIINSPARGIGKVTITRLADYARRFNVSMLDAARESGMIESITKRAAVAIAKFVALLDRIGEHVHAPVEEIIGQVLSQTGYEQILIKSDTDEDQERLANIRELMTAARQFDQHHPGQDQLETFLEQASLVNDIDGWEDEVDRVSLMTIHSAKGLEFPIVFIVGLEEGILPHERSRGDALQLEEERRLLFVAITRAEEQLQLSLSRYRDFRGSRQMTVPSQFLMEIPRDMLQSDTLEVATPEWEVSEQEPEEEQIFSGEPSATSFDFGALRLSTAADMVTPAEKMTAAPMAQNDQSVDSFHQGMLVQHPEFGLGKIVALSGVGQRRRATVNFVSGAGQKKFVIAQSPLRPAKS